MCLTNDIQTYRSLRDGGMTRAGIRSAVAAGELQHVRRGIYARAGACPEVITAVAHGGMLGCQSAARHLGMWVLSDDQHVHVWLNAAGHRRHLRAEEDPENGCHCVDHWDAGGNAVHLTPSVPRILRQILHCQGVEHFFVALESARRLKLVDARGLQWLMAHTNAEGREAVRLSRADADSGLESLLRWRLRRHGFTVRTQVTITGVGQVDLLIAEVVIVEADGKGNHDAEPHRHRDLVRDAVAATWGYRALRFDYAMIIHEWELVESAILAAVAAVAAA
jgi:very-short-patch-repair endonuclease